MNGFARFPRENAVQWATEAFLTAGFEMRPGRTTPLWPFIAENQAFVYKYFGHFGSFLRNFFIWSDPCQSKPDLAQGWVVGTTESKAAQGKDSTEDDFSQKDGSKIEETGEADAKKES